MTLLIPRKGSIFQEEIFCLLSFVDEKSHVTAIVYDNVHTLTLAIIIGPRQHLGCIPSTLQVILLSMRKQQQNRHEQSRKLHELHLRSAPRTFNVSMRTAVWTVMWRDPDTRAPFNGFVVPNSVRHVMRPGISTSAISISLRP